MSSLKEIKKFKISDVVLDATPPSHVTPSMVLNKLFILTLSGLRCDTGEAPQTIMLLLGEDIPWQNIISLKHIRGQCFSS